MLLIMGFYNLINGFVLLQKADWLEDRFIASSADTWGWIVLIWGALQLIASFRLLSNGKGRMLATTLASVSMVLWFALLFVAPFASLIGTAVNFAIISSVFATEEA